MEPPQPLPRASLSPESLSLVEEPNEMDFDPFTPSFSHSPTITSLWSPESLLDQQGVDLSVASVGKQ